MAIKFEDCRVGMKVKSNDRTYVMHSDHGTIRALDHTGPRVFVEWDSGFSGWYKAFLQYLDFVNPPSASAPTILQVAGALATAAAKKPDPEKEYSQKQYAFFATCTAPGCCPKCSAPRPCKYHP